MQNLSTFMFDKSHFIIKKPIPDSGFVSGSNMLSDNKIQYIWSNNLYYIKQYSSIIDEQFDEELNLQDVYKKISDTDFRSFYRLFMIQEKVIGGFRMVINDPYTEYSLPSEKPGFTFKDTFKKLDLANNKYTELSRFAVDPSYRNNMEHYRDGFHAYKEKMIELGVKYLFLCSSKSRFRIYNRFATKHFNLIAHKDIDVSGWEKRYRHLEFYVCVYEVTK